MLKAIDRDHAQMATGLWTSRRDNAARLNLSVACPGRVSRVQIKGGVSGKTEYLMKTPTILGIAGVSGFLSVALGAFAAHGLEGRIDAAAIKIFETAADYQARHTLALLGLAALQGPRSTIPGLGNAVWAFVVGIVVFCGSLYALALTGFGILGAITPIGGLAFMIGWALTARMALKMHQRAG